MQPQWVEALLSDSRQVVRQLLHEDPLTLQELRQQVESYRRQVHRQAGPLTDVAQVDALSAASLALLDQVSTSSDHEKQWAQVAVRYFVLEDDGDGDLSSPFGFDDDIEVYNAVVSALGHPERAIPY